jgi:hypothetical protein
MIAPTLFHVSEDSLTFASGAEASRPARRRELTSKSAEGLMLDPFW